MPHLEGLTSPTRQKWGAGGQVGLSAPRFVSSTELLAPLLAPCVGLLRPHEYNALPLRVVSAFQPPRITGAVNLGRLCRQTC